MESHPLRMRGLKQKRLAHTSIVNLVASFTDAWIETNSSLHLSHIKVSHPLRMRGLKRRSKTRPGCLQSRILYGCVD